MPNAFMFKGGTPLFSPLHCQGDPQYYIPPFGKPRYKDTPVSNAHYDGQAPRSGFVASEPLKPMTFPVQRDTLKYFKPVVGDTVYLVLVPSGHYLWGVRFDVGEDDPTMAGGTVSITGFRASPNLADPDDPDQYTYTEIAAFATAATAQGLADIPLDVASSNILWVGSSISGTPVPMYVAPQLAVINGQHVHIEYGAILLGIKIKTLPTGKNIWDARGDFYMAAIINGFEFKTNT